MIFRELSNAAFRFSLRRPGAEIMGGGVQTPPPPSRRWKIQRPSRARVKTLVAALVLTRINYCLAVYGNGTQKKFDRIQKILNFAARVIFGRRKFDHVADLRERLRWMTSRQMPEVRTLAVAHQALRQGVPESLASLFVRCGETRDRPTRQDEQLRLPRPRTEAGKRRFGYRAPALYDVLPAGFADMPQRSFARAVRAYLTDARPASRR